MVAPVSVQLQMPYPPARARRTDPSTSHEAASRNADGLAKQTAFVLDLVRQYPGMTACELARRATIAGGDYTKMRYAISRRASELKRAGLISAAGTHVCTIEGSRQTIWVPT